MYIYIYIYLIYIYTYIYIFTNEVSGSFELPMESCPEWDLDRRSLISVQLS